MKCPACAHPESRVIDSRPSSDGSSIRRRRECLHCQKRFTTYETIETVPITVVKKDKSRESFDRNKVLNSIIRACDKRLVTRGELDSVVSSIEMQLQNSLQTEIPSSRIGEMVMERAQGRRRGGLRPFRIGLPAVQGHRRVFGRAEQTAGRKEIICRAFAARR